MAKASRVESRPKDPKTERTDEPTNRQTDRQTDGRTESGEAWGPWIVDFFEYTVLILAALYFLGARACKLPFNFLF